MGFYSNYYGEGYLVLIFMIMLNLIRIVKMGCFMANLGGVQGVYRGCEICLFFDKIRVHENRVSIVTLLGGGLVW